MGNRIFVCGDTHGSNDIKKLTTREFPEQKELTKEDVLVQLGDFGLIWYPIGVNKEQEYWLDWLMGKNFTTAVVLGNHENYDVIETFPWEKKWGNDVQYLERNGNKLYFLKRGAIYEINGRKILAIGGAHSIDKNNRTPHISWWEQEDITYAEMKNCLQELDEKGYEVDYVLTHTCPLEYVMEFIHVNKWNFGKIRDTTAEFLDEINNLVSFKHWYFGHMHTDWTHVEKYEENGVEKIDRYTCCYNASPEELE